MRRSLVVLPVLLTVVFLMSCGGGNDPVTPPGSGDQDITPTITLAQSSALPLAAIAITGLPAGRDDLYGLVTVTSKTVDKGAADVVTNMVYIEASAGGGYHLITPFHPTAPKIGGTVEFQVTNGSNVNSTIVTLDIAALPVADGAFAAMVGSLQTMLDGWLPIHRASREQLRTTPSANFPDNWYPLFFAQDIIDSPDNPNSLQAIIDGTAPFTAGDDFDLDLLDRVIGLVGAQELLDGNVAFLDSMIAWGDTLDSGETNFLRPDGEPNKAFGEFTISTVGQLDYYMTMANNSRSRTEGHPGEILRGMGLGISALGILTAGSPVAGVMGASLWAYQTMEQSKAKLLPSTFASSATRCSFSKTAFDEDDPGQGSWSNFMVAGSSEGMALDKLALEAIMQFVGLRGQIQFGQWADGFADVAQEVGKFAISEGGNSLINDSSGLINLPGRVWPAVNASDPGYSAGSVTGGSAISLQGKDYRPEDVGDATLQVKTKSGLFGYQATLVNQVISVHAIQVTVSPGAEDVEPGESVEFSAQVDFANVQTLAWTATAGDLTINSNTSATLKTPDEAWEEPIEVKARATTTSGLRGRGGAPERAGRASVTTQDGEIVIDPLFVCVKPGEHKSYQAVIVGFPPEDQAVQWSAALGTFEGNVYQAPSSHGSDTITARSVVDPELEGTAFVQVSECICWFSASMFGEVTTNYTGEFANMDSNPAITVLTLAVTDETSYPALSGQIVPGLPDGAIGRFPIVMNYSPSISTLYIGMDDEDTGMVSPVLNLISNSNGKIEGFITGEVHRLDGNGIAGSVSLDIHFEGETGFLNGGNGCDRVSRQGVKLK